MGKSLIPVAAHGVPCGGMSLIRQGYLSLAKVQVDGSNPLARSILPSSVADRLSARVALESVGRGSCD
jgi:hypothetical protein